MKRLIIIVSLLVVVTLSEDMVVETDVGTLVGFTDEIDVEATPFRLAKFLGIPYAEAPVGDLRFRKPIAKPPLTEPYQAQSLGSPCMQILSVPNPYIGSEDCLFLNVYSPASAVGGENKVPVMIWIHGGAFALGTSSSYPPDRLVANGPVMVVTLNYRLSIWGFLSTGDSNSRGNYGLWDQQLAIKWVHNNIDKFGGDPSCVTIFGESAGSYSVIYQGLFPGNTGLFQRIIGQSGSPIGALRTSRAPVLDAREFGSLAGCETVDNKQLVDCLRSLDNDKINGTLNDLSNGLAYRSLFKPYSDGEFIDICVSDWTKDSFVGEASKDLFASMDLLIGVTAGEGYLYTPPSPFHHAEWETFLPDSFSFKETLVPKLISVLMGESSQLLVDAIVAEYANWDDPESTESIREKYIDLVGDMLFLGPAGFTVNFLANLSSRQSSYLYYLTAKPEKHSLPTPSWASRPNHADDIVYVFGGESVMKEFGIKQKHPLEDWEKVLSNDVMTMWTNFAKTGNPNRPRDLGIDWLPYTRNHQHYLDISRTLTSRNVKRNVDGRRVNFWIKVVPEIIVKIRKMSSLSDDRTCEKNVDCSP